mgnify:CR=1 FL=1
MENKYITVAYKLYAVTDREKELREEAPASHPFQFISGIGYTLERFEKEILALKKGDKFNFTILVRKHTAKETKTTYARCPNLCSAVRMENSIATISSKATSSC